MSFNDQGKSGDYRHLFDEYPFIVHVYGLSFIICSVALLLYYNGRNKPAIRMRRPLLCIAHTSALLVKGYAFVIVPAWGADSCPCLVHLFCYYVAPVCSFWLYVIRLYMIVLQCNKQAWHLQHYYKSEGLIEDKHFQPLRTIKQSTTICGKLIFDIKWNKSMSSYPRWTKVTFVVYLLVFVALLTGHVRANGAYAGVDGRRAWSMRHYRIVYCTDTCV